MFPFGLIQNRPAAKTRWGGPVNLRLLDGVLQGLAGLESGQLGSLNGDFLAGLGVAALACGALTDLKGAEADQRDLVALAARHPHIFGGDESIKDWDSLKNKEKGRLTLTDELESVPKVLPALMRAAKLQKRAARYGVETPADAAAIAKAAGTVETARDKAAAEQAMGELLFAAAALARKAGLDPEQALQKCNAAFTAENTQTQES